MKLNSLLSNRLILSIVLASFSIPAVLAQSDTPCGAPVLSVGTSCSMTLGDAAGATRATAAENVADASCGSYSNPVWVHEDTWFAFVAPASGLVNIETFAPQPITYQDDYPFAGAAVYSGACGSLTEMICDYDAAQNNYPEFNLVGLTPGVTYYIRFWGNSSTVKPDKTYNICIWEPAPPPVNDECVNALPAVVNSGVNCDMSTSGTIEGATQSSQSNWCGGTANDDVWFSFVATNTSHYFDLENIAGSTTSLSYQVFSGTCGSLSNATCNSGVANNLVVGDTYFVRVWSTGSTFETSTFDLCITSPPVQPSCAANPPAGNTACTATAICNLDGYCGTTSGTYTDDYWPELLGQFCNASIENNSFLTFTAQATTISFSVWVNNCNLGNGIQIMVFSAANCASGPVTSYACWNPGNVPVAPVLIEATGLTVGDQYYIMIDGNSNDICDYVIGANEGFQLPVEVSSVTGDTSICLGESIDLFATGGTGNYTWSPSTGLNSTVGDTVTSTPTAAGSITYTVSSATTNSVCPSTAGQFTLTIGEPVYSTDTHVSCSSYTWIDGTTYTASNNTATYTISEGSVTGCDSIITLDLTINNTPVNSTDTQMACGSYTWIDGVNYTASNNTATYTIVGGAVGGCDSIINLDLTILSPATGTDVQVGCGSYTWIDGVNYTSSNNSATFTIVGGSTAGCDSIVTLDLTILPPSTGTDVQVACGSYTWIDGINYASSNNTATFTIVGGSTSGCDSIVTLDLTITPSATSNDVQVECGSYDWIDGITYTSSNNTATYTIVGGATTGCDSIVTLDLTILPPATSTDMQVACESYTWMDGVTYTSNNNTATFTIPGGATTGCDSIVMLDLTINNTVTGTDVQAACGSYTWVDGIEYTANNNTATYTIVGGATTGCDSIVTLDLTINNTVTGTDVQVACEAYTWIDGIEYTTNNNAATYTIIGGSAAGCDSIVTLDLTILSPVFGTDVQFVCGSYTWIDGNTYTASNNTATYTIVGGSAAGCDSIVTLDLTILSAVTGTDVQFACESYTWIDGNIYTASNNTATYTIAGGSVSGCDSIIVLDLTVFPGPIVNLGEDLNVCDEEVTLSPGDNYNSYLWSDGSGLSSITVTEDGNYSVYVTDANGCSGSDDITVIDNCSFSIWVPNSFTPDGDEFNQTFTPVASDDNITNYSMLIFDRWGHVVFETYDIGIGWDGTLNGKQVQDGIYVWKIVISLDTSSENLQYIGHVSLLK